MLKHKIRKSRKNILSLLEAVSSETQQEKPELSRQGKKDKKRKEKAAGEADGLGDSVGPGRSGLKGRKHMISCLSGTCQVPTPQKTLAINSKIPKNFKILIS